MSIFFVWVGAAVILAAADVVVGSGYLVVLGAACLPPAIAAFLGASLLSQCLIFVVLGIAGCLFGNLWLRKHWKGRRYTAEETQHLDEGNLVIVHDWNRERQTKVNFRGAVWQAEAEPGAECEPGLWKIVGNRGNFLILKPLDPKEHHDHRA